MLQTFLKDWFPLQLNICQKLLFLHQLTHNKTTDCSLNYKFSTWILQAQNMLRTCCVHKLVFCFCFDIQNNLCTQQVLNMFLTCSKLVIFIYWTRKSMNNLSSYCGLVDGKIRASDKDLPVLLNSEYKLNTFFVFGKIFQHTQFLRFSTKWSYTIHLASHTIITDLSCIYSELWINQILPGLWHR